MIFSSKLIENAVNAFSTLPGIGKKTALRLVLHLLNSQSEEVGQFLSTLQQLKEGIANCIHCNNLSEQSVCSICTDMRRNRQVLCVVENIRDIIAIESTQQYSGLYHVIGNLLSPIDGIGPDQLFLNNLRERIINENITEVVMALSPSIEGDTTVYYISKLIKETGVSITSIARGISFGGELEYTDEYTLGRAIAKRLPIEMFVKIAKE